VTSSQNFIRILGIDPGSIRTGFAVIEASGSRLRYIASGVIELDAKLPFSTRLLALSKDLFELIERHRVQDLAIEGLFFAKNAQSALKLGHARGVILMQAAARDVAIHEYSPAEVKASVCGSGRADKDQIAKMVRILLKLPANTKFLKADQSDAIALALTHAQVISLKKTSRRPASEMETAKRLGEAAKSKGKKNDRPNFWQDRL